MPKLFIKKSSIVFNKFFSPSLLLTRIYVSISIFLNVSAATIDHDSVLGTAVRETGAPSVMMWCAWVMCGLALIDIIINDFLPNKYCLKFVSEHRHVLYMVLGMISISLSVAVITFNPAPFLIGRLWLDGSVATIVAFLDIYVRRGYIGLPTHIQPN